MNPVGIMQGRLLPSEDGRIQCFPSRRWRDEFALASSLGFDAIEWIYEGYGAEANPIASDEGVRQMRMLTSRSGVAVASLCADVLLDVPLFRKPPSNARDGADLVPWLLRRCRHASIERLVLPFVSTNEMRTVAEIDRAGELLRDWRVLAAEVEVEIHVETSLPPQGVISLLELTGSDDVKITYDIGNSLQFGFDAREELSTYAARIGSVHVKDSTTRGSTVPLGRGDADFSLCFQALAGAGYGGPLVLQAARVPGEEPLATARRDVTFIRQCWAAAAELSAIGSRAK